MKLNRSTWTALGLLILVASLYRIWDGRPLGFAPQIAMAIFGGAIIADKKLAFVLPLASMLLSDVLYQVLFLNGLTETPGFYAGQWVNYLLFAGLTVFGFGMKKINVRNIAGFSISGSLLFFLASNFTVWLGGGGYHHPKTFQGLLLTYADGLAFYREYGLFANSYGNLLIGDLFFCALLFGSYALSQQKAPKLA
ncbi:hypothetical protein SAMN05444008_104308 [Cnuella takakiae]|uniref:Uncharacterized protein n=1 Tax=Cnuella takakiae TaxID=1302690 RepID=A0A1M4YKP4_9BACT|nr:DUF6580 family putative transport protein [Cnuella takakiae]OLY93173.1 hypothetical protein BUE76_15715 [Cnuella takakiae]SHF05976.1 hypothetical protein SAMN05444008_104308 [Cnuella takakiae]